MSRENVMRDLSELLATLTLIYGEDEERKLWMDYRATINNLMMDLVRFWNRQDRERKEK